MGFTLYSYYVRRRLVLRSHTTKKHGTGGLGISSGHSTNVRKQKKCMFYFFDAIGETLIPFYITT